MKETTGIAGNIKNINEIYEIITGTEDKSCKIPYCIFLSNLAHETLKPSIDQSSISRVSIVEAIIKNIHGREYKEGESYESYEIEFCNITDKNENVVFLDIEAYTVFLTSEGEMHYFNFETNDKDQTNLIKYLIYLMNNCKFGENLWYKYTPGVGLEKEGEII